jgi:aryl sulfotransferase
MKILQIGYPKSGNYWLYRIIQEALEIAGVEQKNYIRHHPIYPIARKWELSYPEQVDINMMDILYPACFFRISSIFRKRIENLEAYINSNTHIWTHSNYCPTSERVFPLFDSIVYIIRDPRDVALSRADFAFTPYMMKHYPTWHRSPSEYLQKEAAAIAHEWNAHIGDYLKYAERHQIMILFYERLQQRFEQELQLLLSYLGFPFFERQRNRIADKVNSDRMRRRSPQHVRKAEYYKWFDEMPDEIIEQMNALTEDYLIELGYPVEKREEKLPKWKQRKIVVDKAE